jgi:protein involved in temperature-dependent protein secretion
MSSNAPTRHTLEAALGAGDYEIAARLSDQLFADDAQDLTAMVRGVEARHFVGRHDEALAILARLDDPHRALRGVRQLRDFLGHERELFNRRQRPAYAATYNTLGRDHAGLEDLGSASSEHARGHVDAAGKLLIAAKPKFATSRGTLTTVRGEAISFVELRDCDDLCGPQLVSFFEQGEETILFNLPMEGLARLQLRAPVQTYEEQLWVPATVTPNGGGPVTAFVPSMYPGSGLGETASVRTGQQTALYAVGDGPITYQIALGQRAFRLTLLDGSMRSIGILSIREIAFDSDRKRGFFSRLFS